jgi:hypothetical protein
MKKTPQSWPHLVFSLVLILSLLDSSPAQEQIGNLSGQIKDPRGGLIVGARVTLISQKGEAQIALTDGEGKYLFRQIAAGRYSLKVEKAGFNLFEAGNLEVRANLTTSHDVVLEIRLEEQKVEIPADSDKPSIAPDENKNAIVFRGTDLDALPDDPEALAAALRALAGTAAGPDGGEIYIDGFGSRNLPPKSSIREIRINRNPFSAEFERIGYGRIEIITKAGTNELEGSLFYRFNDDVLNARNPFAPTRPPFQSNRYGGDLSGSFLKKKASFFIDVDRRRVNDSAIVNAMIVDGQFRIAPLRQIIQTPEQAAFLNARADFQINPNHTLSLRYGLTAKSDKNEGVGEFALISQAYESSNTNQTLQFAHTSIFKQKIINELRFQFERFARRAESESIAPAIIVSDSFIGGGSTVGAARFAENRWELSDHVTFAPKNHTVRLGARARAVNLRDVSPANYNGTFIFNGGPAPRLENGQIVLGTDGQPILENITSIERYRRTLFFRQRGFSPVEIRRRGGGAAQFSINGGNAKTEISQLSLSGFVQDDWRAGSNLALNFGLRFETQTNIGRNFDLAPRISFAWSRQTGEKKKLTTVLRGGFGVFYSRFGENLVLDAEKFDGHHQQRFIVTETSLLDSFVNVPGVRELIGLGQPVSLRQIAADIRVPVSFHTAFSLEQELPANTVFTATYSDLRLRRALRSRNVNAPAAAGLPRPRSGFGDIYQYESSGRFDSRRLSLNFSTRFWKFANLFLRYDLNSAKSDTDGAASFPVNQFDVSGEYGRSALDVRHSFTLSAIFNAPFGIRLSPLILAASGRPFNITLGQDLNGDGLFTERPARAGDPNRPSIVYTRFGIFDRQPLSGATIIPRNFGTGPVFFAVSLRAGKTFKFNLWNAKSDGTGKKPGAKRYSLNLSAQIWNLLNRPNLNLPIGNLTSPFFGRPASTAGSFGAGDPLSGSRVIELQARFSF